MNLYRNESNDPKTNAQRNLMGRTHYVDDDTLRFHKSRVLATHVTDDGLLFAIITADALDMDNTKRGFRYAIFDVFGTVIDRLELAEAFRTRQQAAKAMWASLNGLDAKAVTIAGIVNAKHHFEMEMTELRKRISR